MAESYCAFRFADAQTETSAKSARQTVHPANRARSAKRRELSGDFNRRC